MTRLPGCTCDTIAGVRVDHNEVPLWVLMVGCPRCDKSIYSPFKPPPPNDMRKQ